MRTFKKTLSLVLCLAMVIGTFTIGLSITASAAADFTVGIKLFDANNDEVTGDALNSLQPGGTYTLKYYADTTRTSLYRQGYTVFYTAEAFEAVTAASIDATFSTSTDVNSLVTRNAGTPVSEENYLAGGINAFGLKKGDTVLSAEDLGKLSYAGIYFWPTRSTMSVPSGVIFSIRFVVSANATTGSIFIANNFWGGNPDIGSTEQTASYNAKFSYILSNKGSSGTSTNVVVPEITNGVIDFSASSKLKTNIKFGDDEDFIMTEKGEVRDFPSEDRSGNPVYGYVRMEDVENGYGAAVKDFNGAIIPTGTQGGVVQDGNKSTYKKINYKAIYPDDDLFITLDIGTHGEYTGEYEKKLLHVKKTTLKNNSFVYEFDETLPPNDSQFSYEVDPGYNAYLLKINSKGFDKANYESKISWFDEEIPFTGFTVEGKSDKMGTEAEPAVYLPVKYNTVIKAGFGGEVDIMFCDPTTGQWFSIGQVEGPYGETFTLEKFAEMQNLVKSKVEDGTIEKRTGFKFKYNTDDGLKDSPDKADAKKNIVSGTLLYFENKPATEASGRTRYSMVVDDSKQKIKADSLYAHYEEFKFGETKMLYVDSCITISVYVYQPDLDENGAVKKDADGNIKWVSLDSGIKPAAYESTYNATQTIPYYGAGGDLNPKTNSSINMYYDFVGFIPTTRFTKDWVENIDTYRYNVSYCDGNGKEVLTDKTNVTADSSRFTEGTTDIEFYINITDKEYDIFLNLDSAGNGLSSTARKYQTTSKPVKFGDEITADMFEAVIYNKENVTLAQMKEDGEVVGNKGFELADITYFDAGQKMESILEKGEKVVLTKELIDEIGINNKTGVMFVSVWNEKAFDFNLYYMNKSGEWALLLTKTFTGKTAVTYANFVGVGSDYENVILTDIDESKMVIQGKLAYDKEGTAADNVKAYDGPMDLYIMYSGSDRFAYVRYYKAEPENDVPEKNYKSMSFKYGTVLYDPDYVESTESTEQTVKPWYNTVLDALAPTSNPAIEEKKDVDGNVMYKPEYWPEYETNEDGSFVLDADGNKVPKKDEDGDIIYSKNEVYEPVYVPEYEPEYQKDEEGDFVLDSKGNKVAKTDEEGNIVYSTNEKKDEEGNTIYKLDDKGNKIPKTDANGEIVYSKNIVYTDEAIMNDLKGNYANRPYRSCEYVGWTVYYVPGIYTKYSDLPDESEWIEGFNDKGDNCLYTTTILKINWKDDTEFRFRIYDDNNMIYCARGKDGVKYYWANEKPCSKEDAVLNHNPDNQAVVLFIPHFEKITAENLGMKKGAQKDQTSVYFTVFCFSFTPWLYIKNVTDYIPVIGDLLKGLLV